MSPLSQRSSKVRPSAGTGGSSATVLLAGKEAGTEMEGGGRPVLPPALLPLSFLLFVLSSPPRRAAPRGAEAAGAVHFSRGVGAAAFGAGPVGKGGRRCAISVPRLVQALSVGSDR